LNGYLRAFAAAGRLVDESLVRYSDFREQGGHDAMGALLDSGEVPSAVFVANNLMTVGVMECLVERGVGVPGDVGVVGFDEIPWADLVRPSITTVAQPTYDEGRQAAQLLVQRLSDPEAEPTTVVLESTLNVRESSTRP
jgi:LacI family transcriptional regulator